MSGGAWEYVMGNYNDTIASSGFTSMPDSIYYDKYTSSTASTGCNGEVCMGHALSETAEWYSDYQIMLNVTYPWLGRGGYYSNPASAGVFGFGSAGAMGGSNTSHSFRLVMSPSI